MKDGAAGWMTLSEALQLVVKQLRDESEARRAIIERARVGALPFSAEQASGTFENRPLSQADWEVPSKFWDEVCDEPDPSWHRSCLIAYNVGDRLGFGRRRRPEPLQLVGVTVIRSSIYRMLASLTPSESAPLVSTAGAESECSDWLATEFAADPDRRRSKSDFRNAALARFPGRLSARGFNDRVWPTLAQQHGRSGPGAKRKS